MDFRPPPDQPSGAFQPGPQPASRPAAPAQPELPLLGVLTAEMPGQMKLTALSAMVKMSGALFLVALLLPVGLTDLIVGPTPGASSTGR